MLKVKDALAQKTGYGYENLRDKDKSVFIIYCSAGISRSGAVAMFLYEKFRDEIDKELFYRDNSQIFPNLYILGKLKEFDKT